MASSGALGLLELPKEIIVGICYFLDPKDTVNLSLVCNSAYLMIQNNPIIWRFYCHKFGFVQSKKGRKWCLERLHEVPENAACGTFSGRRYAKEQGSIIDDKRRMHMPKEEVDAFSIEFGEDEDFLEILEYNWWAGGRSGMLVNQGKKPVPDLDDGELESIRQDISLATELVNWRLVFYMNVLNEDSNHIFWLRIGTSIDIMTPITSVKIDPKIYKGIDDSIIDGIFDFATKIKYLSTLHTCRHFIRLPCPIRIREILIGGRIGKIITSEPSSHGRYLLELPKELVHVADNVYELSGKHGDREDFLRGNGLQLPVRISRKATFLDQFPISGGHLSVEEREVGLEEMEDLEALYKSCSSSIEFLTVANAFISYASNPNWETSLTPRSISAFRQIGLPRGGDCRLFAEVLSQIQRGEKGVREQVVLGVIHDYYSKMNLTHNPVNCTTPCSVINRTCNLEFQNIKQYFKMLCSNSIIFNMFATSINLQDSPFDSGQAYSCWCEYPKSLLGCTWYYNPSKSNLCDIKSFSSGVFSSVEDSSEEANATKQQRKLGPITNLELMLSIVQTAHHQERRLSKRFISLNIEEMSLADLVYLVKANLDEMSGDSTKEEQGCYYIFVLKGVGWRRFYDRESEECEDSEEVLSFGREVERRIYGENLTRNEKTSSKLRAYSGDLLGNLVRNFFFVNGEKIIVEVKRVETEEIREELKEQYKIQKEFVIPVSWSSDGSKLSKVSFLPMRSEGRDHLVSGLNASIGNSSSSEEYQFGLQRTCTGITNMSTMPSFSSFSSLETHMLNSSVKFSKCKIITLSRESNRFKSQRDVDDYCERSNYCHHHNHHHHHHSHNHSNSHNHNHNHNHHNHHLSRDTSVQSPEVRHELCLNSIVKDTNEVYKDLVTDKAYSDNFSRLASLIPEPIHKILDFSSYSSYGNDGTDSLKEDRIIKNQYKIAILQSSQDTRQFEFHSERSDIILIGTSLGKIKLIDRYNDVILAEQGISLSPIIGLSWFNYHPQTFVAGSCLLGAISILSFKENPFYQPADDSSQDRESSYQGYGRSDRERQDDKLPYLISTENKSKSFPQLSSLSVNATDDFYLASGFGKSVGLYSTYTGSQIKILPGMHMSHINIVRFANYHPHVFSTASFDSSCKLWDLRQKINGNDPVIKFELPCMAIMSCFSPRDDLGMVVSGVDDYVKQLDLRYRESSSSSGGRGGVFTIPPLRDPQSYRRSVYNSNGDFVLSVNTKDKYLRIFDSRSLSPQFKFGCFNMLNSHYEGESLIKSKSSSLVVHTFTEWVASRNQGSQPRGSHPEVGGEAAGLGHSRDSGEIADEEAADGGSALETERGTLPIGDRQATTLEREGESNREKDYGLLSVRGHPIYADIGGFLISESSGSSKLALLKFGHVYDDGVR